MDYRVEHGYSGPKGLLTLYNSIQFDELDWTEGKLHRKGMVAGSKCVGWYNCLPANHDYRKRTLYGILDRCRVGSCDEKLAAAAELEKFRQDRRAMIRAAQQKRFQELSEVLSAEMAKAHHDLGWHPRICR